MLAFGEILPVGNDYLVTYGNALTYETQHENAREFAFTFGLLNNKGGSETTNLQDKVTAYFGHRMEGGAGDGWVINGVLEICDGVSRNAQWAEIDMKNDAQHFGSTPGVMGLAAPAVYHFTFNGFSTYDTTGVLAFMQSGPGKVGRNIIFANGCRYSGIENYDSMEVLIENNGAPGYGWRSRGPISKFWQQGPSGFGIDALDGVPLRVARTIRLSDPSADANHHELEIDWCSGAVNVICRNDDGSLRCAPWGFDTVNMIMRPVPDNAVELGYEGLRWKRASSYRLSLKPPICDTPTHDGELTIEAPSNNVVRIMLRGSDGLVRAATLPLSFADPDTPYNIALDGAAGVLLTEASEDLWVEVA